jgi:uncharacterized lipoprotein YehR (DUF1307 family)
MKVAIIKKSEINNCLSALQYTDECVQCDKIFSCKIKSIFHINGLNKKVQYETDKIIEEHEIRISKLKMDALKTLKSISL